MNVAAVPPAMTDSPLPTDASDTPAPGFDLLLAGATANRKPAPGSGRAATGDRSTTDPEREGTTESVTGRPVTDPVPAPADDSPVAPDATAGAVLAVATLLVPEIAAVPVADVAEAGAAPIAPIPDGAAVAFAPGDEGGLPLPALAVAAAPIEAAPAEAAVVAHAPEIGTEPRVEVREPAVAPLPAPAPASLPATDAAPAPDSEPELPLPPAPTTPTTPMGLPAETAEATAEPQAVAPPLPDPGEPARGAIATATATASDAAAPVATAVQSATNAPAVAEVRDAPVPTTASPPAPAEQLVSVLRPLRHGPDGAYRLSLEMRPPELGRIELRVELRDGVLHATLRAEHESTQQALRDAMTHLRARLETEGIRAGRLTVDDSTANADMGSTGHRDGNGGRSDDRLRPGREVPIPPALDLVEATETADGLDVRL